MNFTTIALLATGAVGMLGWYFAWRGRGEIIAARKEVEAAEAGEATAKQVAFENGGRAVTAETLAGARLSQLEGLQMQLDGERKSRQHLVDELTKAGVAVGPVVVESALDRLYKDSRQGGPGSDPGSGGDPQRVSGQPAGPAGSSSSR
jgi:hypothetical protein